VKERDQQRIKRKDLCSNLQIYTGNDMVDENLKIQFNSQTTNLNVRKTGKTLIIYYLVLYCFLVSAFITMWSNDRILDSEEVVEEVAEEVSEEVSCNRFWALKRKYIPKLNNNKSLKLTVKVIRNGFPLLRNSTRL